MSNPFDLEEPPVQVAPPPKSVTLEVMEPVEKQLQLVIKQNNLEIESASFLTDTFVPLLRQAEEWSAKANAIKVKDENDTGTMTMARITRLELRKVRIAAEKAKDGLKAEGLRRNSAIQGAFNIVKFLTEPLEEKLLEQEKFVERAEAKRKVDLRAVREGLLLPYSVDTSYLVLADMPELQFQTFLEITKTNFEKAKIEAAKVEADRIAKEKSEADERIRVKAENEKLKREKDEADAKVAKAKADADAVLAAERKKAADEAARIKADADAKAKKEKDASDEAARKAKEASDAKIKAAEDARKKAEAEAKKIKDAEAAKQAEEIAAKKRAEAAPEKEKLKAFATSIRALHIPALSSGILSDKLYEQTEKFAVWVEKQAETL